MSKTGFIVLQSVPLVTFDCSSQMKTVYTDKIKYTGQVELQII